MKVAVLMAGLLLCGSGPEPKGPTRLLVLTDIGSLTAGVGEPDDGQSLIRLMLYANEFEIEGLVASSNMGHGQRVRPDLIRRVVEAYGRDLPNLRRHDSRYPAAERLLGVVKAGQPVAGPKVAVSDSVGEGKDTEASDWIIRVVDRDDPRPLWVVIWGGSADLAQALDKVRRTRTPEQLAAFVAKIKVNSIVDQDSTGVWIKKEFKDLFVITQERAFRGVYRGGDPTLVSSAWVKAHLHGHGALGDLYPDYRGGDIFPKLGPVRGIKEGDTPSFLALVPNGLNDPERLEFPGWGGKFEEKAPRRWVDVSDGTPSAPNDPDPRMAGVYRHRPAFQADFQARMDWCVQPFERANHPPKVVLKDGAEARLKVGETLRPDASASSDSDGQALKFAWMVETGASAIRLENANTARPEIKGERPGSASVVLSVTDAGEPRLTRYARLRIRVAE